ncbi:MAG: undecaprenyl-diphosphate phosphatase [Clostridia bacterium]|nr:undecaprenyl-diphosphate phosphatase [Clostridia bacterium]
MEIIKAIIFGIVEGITEWLPVSSTGHLILFKAFMQFKGVSDGFFEMFEVVIQLGAIFAVVAIYFHDIWPFSKDKSKNFKAVKLLPNPDKKITSVIAAIFNPILKLASHMNRRITCLWGKIIVACIPATIIGLLFDEWFEKLFYNPTCVAIALIVFGIAFIVVENWHKGRDARVDNIGNITYKDALIIGAFQLIAAIFPGVSRSGATIIGALLIGISRKVSAEFTFYLAIPVMFGASLLKLLKFGLHFTGLEFVILIIGMIVAFAVSMFIIKFLMNYIKKHDFKVFGIYRIVLGIIVLLIGFTGALK